MKKNIQTWTRARVYGKTESEYNALEGQDRTEAQQAEINHLLSNPAAMKKFKEEGYSL